MHVFPQFHVAGARFERQPQKAGSMPDPLRRKKLREDGAGYKVSAAARAAIEARRNAGAADRYLPRIADTIARGSRLGQRPASTACRKSATCWLNAPGSSRLMV